VFVHIITAHPVTVNFCTSYNKTTIHCSLMRQFPTIIIHFLRSQKLPISVTNNYIECLISQSAISPCKLFLNLSHSIHSFIHSFHWHVQNVTIPCHSQELLPFLSVIYHFLPPFSTHLSSMLPHFILPSISWSTAYITLFWEIYFLPFSVHAQTNVIYLTLTSLL